MRGSQGRGKADEAAERLLELRAEEGRTPDRCKGFRDY